MTSYQEKLKQALALHAGAQKKIDVLKNVKPFFIDLSLRENPVGARVGQTLEDKLAILPLVRDFGFKHILLGTLDYSMPDELEVDDDFMKYMRDNKLDMTSCYAFTQIGVINKQGQFIVDPSMLKLQSYGVPNSLHEIYLSKDGMNGMYDRETLKKSVVASIKWMIENIRGDGGGKPKLLINIVDGCDAF